MPERCCLTNRPNDDQETAEIQRTVSQSELIEPLGAREELNQAAVYLVLPKTTHKSRKNLLAGTCRVAATAYQTTPEFQLAAKSPLAQI